MPENVRRNPSAARLFLVRSSDPPVTFRAPPQDPPASLPNTSSLSHSPSTAHRPNTSWNDLSPPIPLLPPITPSAKAVGRSRAMWSVMGRAGLRALSGGAAPNSGRNLEGKVALVTAATDGIGLAVAQRLGEAGARVLLSSRRQPNVDAAVQKLRAQGLEVSGVVCHVGQPQDRQRLVQTALDTYGAIDILVSNAAVNPVMGSTLEVEEAAWEKIFQVNVTAAAMLVKLVLPHMEKRGGGAVVLVTSVAGFMPFPALGPYSVSKTALLGLVKVLAPELRARGVRLNAVAPGLIQTCFSAALWKNEATKEQTMSFMGIDRLGTPSDVAEVVAFLCSPAASYVVGETVVVAGGTPSRL